MTIDWIDSNRDSGRAALDSAELFVIAELSNATTR
jgi:hypothetical protein